MYLSTSSPAQVTHMMHLHSVCLPHSVGSWTAFNPETVRLMIGMFDRDKSGTINFQEFGSLWKYVNDWQTTFKSYDRDQSGSIDKLELKTGKTLSQDSSLFLSPSGLLSLFILKTGV